LLLVGLSHGLVFDPETGRDVFFGNAVNDIPDDSCQQVIDVSDEHVASIFRIEEYEEQVTIVQAGSKQRNHLHSAFFLAYNFTLMMEATLSSETSFYFHRTIHVI
jgi:hypothetical protein